MPGAISKAKQCEKKGGWKELLRGCGHFPGFEFGNDSELRHNFRARLDPPLEVPSKSKWQFSPTLSFCTFINESRFLLIREHYATSPIANRIIPFLLFPAAAHRGEKKRKAVAASERRRRLRLALRPRRQSSTSSDVFQLESWIFKKDPLSRRCSKGNTV